MGVGHEVVPGALFEMLNGAGGGSYPDTPTGGVVGRWGFTGVQVKTTSLVFTYQGDDGKTGEIVLPPPCVHNWPGTATCAWGTGPWETCTNDKQSRNVWCTGGNDEHCPTDAKPVSSQICKSPGNAFSNPAVIISVCAAIVVVLAVGGAVACRCKRRGARDVVRGQDGLLATSAAGASLPE